MKTHADPHSPSMIVPGDYDYIDSFSHVTSQDGETIPPLNTACLQQAEGRWIEKHIHAARCDICGSEFAHGDLFQHRPSGGFLVLGHTCGRKYGFISDREQYKDIRGRHVERVMWFLHVFPLVKAQCRQTPQILRALRLQNGFAVNIRQKFLKYGSLSVQQVEGLRKALSNADADAARNWTDAPQGRIDVVAEILSTQEKDDPFTGDTVTKMLVRVDTADGCYKAWGTCPARLIGDGLNLKGEVIKLRARFKPSDTDKSFAFFSRPTAELLR